MKRQIIGVAGVAILSAVFAAPVASAQGGGYVDGRFGETTFTGPYNEVEISGQFLELRLGYDWEFEGPGGFTIEAGPFGTATFYDVGGTKKVYDCLGCHPPSEFHQGFEADYGLDLGLKAGVCFQGMICGSVSKVFSAVNIGKIYNDIVPTDSDQNYEYTSTELSPGDPLEFAVTGELFGFEVGAFYSVADYKINQQKYTGGASDDTVEVVKKGFTVRFVG